MKLQWRCKEWECQANVAYNWRATLALPAVVLCWSGTFLFGDAWPLGVIMGGFVILLLGPLSALIHLAMKPVVRYSAGELIVVASGGTGWCEIRKPCRDCRIEWRPDGKPVLKMLPWFFDFVPGGCLPSRMVLIIQRGREDEWRHVFDQCMNTGVGNGAASSRKTQHQE